ncbi:MAG: zf-HC2 domain-containing protein, partial [Candidatus Limnocylindria bacterium]
MTMNRHEPFEELISASLTGDLTAIERQRLDVHLDSCPTCRATLAAFAEQRRIMAGLHHVGPPRDLGARVRTGIERGAFGTLPWWRRPVVLFAGIGGSLAAVAGALLALVLLNGAPDEPNIGAASPTPTPVPVSSATAEPSLEPFPTLPPVISDPSPDATPVEPTAPPPSSAPSPTTTPVPASPEPDVFLAMTGEVDNLALSVQEAPPGESSAPIAEIEDPIGPPVAAELSPDGQWLAFIVERGLSGMTEVRATRISDASASDEPAASPSPSEPAVEIGETIVLGTSLAGSPFLEELAWSPDSRRLAYTLADPEAEGATDAWIFDVDSGEPARLTDVGAAFAASWIPADDEDEPARLWVSVAAEDPTSYVLELPDDEELAPVDPAEDPVHEAAGVFLPNLSPNGSLVIYWDGPMTNEAGVGWAMGTGAEPYLAQHDVRRATYEIANERPLFSDLEVRRDGFTAAAVHWGPDGDAYAVWDTRWTGTSQGAEGTEYPDPRRVYFGHATDRRGLTQFHALDVADLPADGSVVDVKVSPSGEHLLVTVRRPVPGDLSAPRADLL